VTAYPLLVAVTSLAPLGWSIYSVLSKPLTGRIPPLLWTYLAVAIGGVFLLPLIPGSAWAEWRVLDAPGWGALLYLTLPCTVLGFAVWTWLLKYLPASSVGFTVFLNPPLTTASKWVLAAFAPATFVFSIRSQEWLGGALALLGLWIALAPGRRDPRAEP
jgi:drug/metabolite transporter (DMT)-like permease